VAQRLSNAALEKKHSLAEATFQGNSETGLRGRCDAVCLMSYKQHATSLCEERIGTEK
jgi:hypothetical protein